MSVWFGILNVVGVAEEGGQRELTGELRRDIAGTGTRPLNIAVLLFNLFCPRLGIFPLL